MKAVIYDMDGVIIDSEPLWREAIISTFRKVGLLFTEDMCRVTQGMRLYEVIEYWYAQTPWDGMSIKELEVDLLKEVTRLIVEKGVAMDGVKASLTYFKAKGYKIALASSSAMQLIETVLNQLEIKQDFEVINSAEHLAYGKPHPEVFIKTAQQLNVKPIDCLVIEDSFNGLLSAKSALMKVVAIPDKENYNNPRFAIADYQLKSLADITTLGLE